MKRLGVLIFSLTLVSAFILTGCGKTPGGSTQTAKVPANEVQMGPDNFVQTAVTVTKGQTVHFVDLQSGAEHIICVGSNGTCSSTSSDPKSLQNPGFTIQPGGAQDVTFATAGTYHVTCTIHPSMNLTVTVQ